MIALIADGMATSAVRAWTLAALILGAMPCTGVAQSGDERIRLREFSRSEVEDALAALGISESPREVQRLPDGHGARVTLSSNRVIEFGCDGRTTIRETPGRTTYFGSSGAPFAWYDAGTLRFAERSSDEAIGNQISVDPSGRFLVTTDGSHPGRKTLVYATRNLKTPLGVVPVSGSRMRVFSRDGGVLVVGDDPQQQKQVVIAIAYEIEEERLVQAERMTVPLPDVWFGGWFVAEDAMPDGSRVAFVLWRDSPLAHRLYEFSVRERQLRHVSKLEWYAAYVACNPFTVHGRR